MKWHDKKRVKKLLKESAHAPDMMQMRRVITGIETFDFAANIKEAVRRCSEYERPQVVNSALLWLDYYDAKVGTVEKLRLHNFFKYLYNLHTPQKKGAL